MISIKKGIKIVPEGERIMTVTKTELKPEKKPVEFRVTFEDSEGKGSIINRFGLKNEKACEILGIQCDIATNGTLPEGEGIDERDLPEIFMGKTFVVEVKHTEKDGNTYANIRRLKSLYDVPMEDDDLGDDIE